MNILGNVIDSFQGNKTEQKEVSQGSFEVKRWTHRITLACGIILATAACDEGNKAQAGDWICNSGEDCSEGSEGCGHKFLRGRKKNFCGTWEHADDGSGYMIPWTGTITYSDGTKRELEYGSKKRAGSQPSRVGSGGGSSSICEMTNETDYGTTISGLCSNNGQAVSCGETSFDPRWSCNGPAGTYYGNSKYSVSRQACGCN